MVIGTLLIFLSIIFFSCSFLRFSNPKKDVEKYFTHVQKCSTTNEQQICVVGDSTGIAEFMERIGRKLNHPKLRCNHAAIFMRSTNKKELLATTTQKIKADQHMMFESIINELKQEVADLKRQLREKATLNAYIEDDKENIERIVTELRKSRQFKEKTKKYMKKILEFLWKMGKEGIKVNQTCLCKELGVQQSYLHKNTSIKYALESLKNLRLVETNYEGKKGIPTEYALTFLGKKVYFFMNRQDPPQVRPQGKKFPWIITFERKHYLFD
jgi:regulator of replication initiation timing